MVCAAGASTWSQPLHAEEAEQVVVVGDTLHELYNHFSWTVTNHGNKNIVSFRAPRHLGTEPAMPPGWTFEMPPSSMARNGEAVFKAVSPAAGIRPGQSAKFEIHDVRRDRPGRTKRASTVVVGFADDSELVIQGVLCPAEETMIQKNIPLVGLAVMFAIFLLVQLIRRRKRSAEPPPAA